MASTFKTTNLGLSNWLETDKPTRSDFVSDNVIIDNSLGAHLNDTTLHLTQEEKNQLSEPYIFDILQGTGEESRTIELLFTPRLVMYYAVDKPLIENSDTGSTVNGGVSAYTYGSSGGISIADKKIILTHGTVDGVEYNLNNSECQYILVGFR